MQRIQVTWIRDGELGKIRVSHPYVWEVTGIDGTVRHFDSKAEALAHWATPGVRQS